MADVSQHYSTGVNINAGTLPYLTLIIRMKSHFPHEPQQRSTNLKMLSSPPTLHLPNTSSSNAPFSASIPIGPDSSSPSKSTEANAELLTLRAAMSTLQTRINNELTTQINGRR